MLVYRRPISQFLTLDGTPTGDREANVDGSVTPQDFYIEPPADETYLLRRMEIYIQDTGSFDAAVYGNAINLTNGITVQVVRSGSVVYDLTAAYTILSNADWARYCHDPISGTWGTGDETFHVRWTFTNDGDFVRLYGSLGDRFRVRIQDNLTGLNSHTFRVAGGVA